MSWFNPFKHAVKEYDEVQNLVYTPPEDKIELFLDTGMLAFMSAQGLLSLQDVEWAKRVTGNFELTAKFGDKITVGHIKLLKAAAEKYFKEKESL